MLIVQLDSDQLSNLIQTAVRKVISETPSHPPQPEPEILFTVKETADFLRLSVPTIYGLISKGEIPVMKRSKRCYFSKAELIDYLKKGRQKTNTEIEKEAENYIKKKLATS